MRIRRYGDLGDSIQAIEGSSMSREQFGRWCDAEESPLDSAIARTGSDRVASS
jgi:hypothetical protein